MVAGTQSSSKGEVEATCSLSDRTTRAMQDEGMGNGARQKGLRAGPRLPMIFQGKPTSRLDPPVWFCHAKGREARN